MGGLWLASSALREIGWKRRQRWLQSLPFALERYVEAVGEDLAEELVVSIRFAARAPSQKHMREVVAAAELSPSLSLRRGDHRHGIVLHSKLTYDSENGFGRLGQRRVLVWLHALTDKVLLVVHADYPISSVRLSWE